MRHLILLTLAMMTSAFASAQTVEVSGVVKDLQGKAVADVIVKVVAGKTTVAFGTTAANGEYVLRFDAGKVAARQNSTERNEAVVTFTHIAYEQDEVPVDLSKRKQTVTSILTPKTIALKEVKVRANPLFVRGDTLSYNLASFLKKGDVTLEDGLKNLPGITISESGAISYMGKGISEFQIEGMNMLGGRYNLATKNIPAEYATQVEVMRHHKSRRIDADEESDNVAINVKLSKRAKFKPFGQPTIGLGTRSPTLTLPKGEGTPSSDGQSPSPLGRDGEGLDLLGALGLTGMMFTDRFQLLGSAKWSNHGNFGTYDLIDYFGSGGVSSLATNRLGKWGGGSSPIGEYLYQKNGYVSLNGIEKIDTFRTVKANADYSWEESRNSFSTQTLYFADGANISVGEVSRPMTRLHRPSVSVTYENNAPDKYLRDNFTARAQFEENECPVNGFSDKSEFSESSENSERSENSQKRTATVVQLTNSLWSTVRTGKHKLSFRSDIGFTRAPSVLLEMNDISQSGQSTTLTTNHSTAADLKLNKKWKLHLPLALEANYNMVECFREAPPQPSPQGREFNPDGVLPLEAPSLEGRAGGEAVGGLRGWKVVPSANLSTSWTSTNKKAHVAAGMRLRWMTFSYLSRFDDKRTTLSELFAEPNMSARYTFSGTSELNLSSSVSNAAGDILDLLTVPVQTSYRSTSVASGVIGKSRSWTTNLGYKKQVPFSYFTFVANASWSMGQRNVLSAQTVSGTAVETSSIFRDSHTRNAAGTVEMSKNILPIYTKLSLSAGADWGSSEQMSQGKFMTAYSSGYHANATADVTPLPWMEIGLSGNYSKSFTRFDGQRRAYDGLGSRGSLAFFPTPQLELRGSYRYVRSLIADSQYKNSQMLSASAQYKARRAVWKLTLNNLLNQRRYTYTLQSGPDRFTHDIALVGRTALLTCKLQLVQK